MKINNQECNERQLNRYKKIIRILLVIIGLITILFIFFILMSNHTLSDCVRRNHELQQQMLEHDVKHQSEYQKLLRKMKLEALK